MPTLNCICRKRLWNSGWGWLRRWFWWLVSIRIISDQSGMHTLSLQGKLCWGHVNISYLDDFTFNIFSSHFTTGPFTWVLNQLWWWQDTQTGVWGPRSYYCTCQQKPLTCTPYDVLEVILFVKFRVLSSSVPTLYFTHTFYRKLQTVITPRTGLAMAYAVTITFMGLLTPVMT